MEQQKIEEIVRRKNERREDEMVRSAERIIEDIIAEQNAIKGHELKVAALREELVKLQVVAINTSDVLGS